MTEMSIEDYLAHGGKLSSPGNAPARYRAEILRLMASFVDSELAASAGFAEAINDAPGIKSRIAAARITLEKADHAERVLRIMSDFGANTERYEDVHPWAARVDRDADIGAQRQGGDMRLSVFHYPIEGWIDAVVMNVLQGLAANVQLAELANVSYQPLAEVFHAIAPIEKRHCELGLEGLAHIAQSEEGRAAAETSIAYWRPRVASGFGAVNSARYERLSRLGLRHRTNAAMLDDWSSAVDAALTDLTLI